MKHKIERKRFVVAPLKYKYISKGKEMCGDIIKQEYC